MKYSRTSVVKPIAGSITMHDILLHDIILRSFITIFYDQT